MWFRHLEPADRRVAVLMSVVASGLLAGLTVTGVWQFLFHEPNPSWERYVVGGDSRPLAQPATGVADVHGVLGDVAAVTTLIVCGWISYRVLAKVSLVALASLVLIIGAILTGGLIAFNALAVDGVVDLNHSGYLPVFTGDVDLVVTDTGELGRSAAIAWTLVHIVSLPVIVALSWIPIRRARIQRENAPAPDASWLDQIEL